MSDSVTIPMPGETPAPAPSVPSVETTPPAATPDPAAAPAPEAPAESTPPAPEASDEGDKPSRSRASERISQLTAQKRASEARAQTAEAEARRLYAELSTLRQTPVDGMTYEQQENARLRAVIKTETLESKIAEHKSANADYTRTLANTFRAKVDAARERMPDFDQVFHTGLPVGQALAELIVDSDKSAEVAYYLGKNPTELAEISQLPPHLQGARIARLEAKVTVPSRRLSAAPPPVPQVGAVSAPSAKDPANMSMSEFSEWFNKQAKG